MPIRQPVISEKRSVVGSRPSRSHVAATLARICANSSGDANGVLYSSAKRAAGSAVPRVPLPPARSGGGGGAGGVGGGGGAPRGGGGGPREATGPPPQAGAAHSRAPRNTPPPPPSPPQRGRTPRTSR